MKEELDQIIKMLNSWERRVLKCVDAHYESERIFKRFNFLIGIPTIILAAIISAVSFYYIGKTVLLWVQMTVGFLGLFQFVLSALHTWLGYSELAIRHHKAGSDYAALRRRIEQLKNLPAYITEDSITEVRESIDKLSKEAPTIPGRVWKKTQIAFRGHGTADGDVLIPDQM